MRQAYDYWQDQPGSRLSAGRAPAAAVKLLEETGQPPECPETPEGLSEQFVGAHLCRISAIRHWGQQQSAVRTLLSCPCRTVPCHNGSCRSTGCDAAHPASKPCGTTPVQHLGMRACCVSSRPQLHRPRAWQGNLPSQLLIEKEYKFLNCAPRWAGVSRLKGGNHALMQAAVENLPDVPASFDERGMMSWLQTRKRPECLKYSRPTIPRQPLLHPISTRWWIPDSLNHNAFKENHLGYTGKELGVGQAGRALGARLKRPETARTDPTWRVWGGGVGPSPQ